MLTTFLVIMAIAMVTVVPIGVAIHAEVKKRKENIQ